MSGGQTKNSALTTALAFHYQVLIGLDKCFSLQEGQAIWFEKDGDVSFVGDDMAQSSQFEVKDYSASLTDNHENLWNTLKNWIDPVFDHKRYGALVLITTQAFGVKTRLKNWNSQTPDLRLQILKEIYAEREHEQLNAEKVKNIVKLQKIVMHERSDDELMELLAKVVLHVEADDLTELQQTFHRKLDGYIPPANQQAFADGLIGFIYGQASREKWGIDKASFDKQREFLTARYGPSLFTIPDFIERDATDEEVEEHIYEMFVKKILEIEYTDVLPEAIGNWLELRNSLIQELHGFPQFHKTANRYREQLINSFSAKYRSACRQKNCSLDASKNLYDLVTGEPPFGIDGYPNPDLGFKNGLIHDAMDDSDRNLKWRIEK